MKKVSFLVITFFLLCLTLTITSCENFLKGQETRDQIENQLKYNNAPERTILIMAEPGTGTCNPSGNQTVKQGYPFDVSFFEEKGWSFAKWQVVYKDNPKKEIPQKLVKIEDPSAKETKITINTSAAVKIIPVCIQRIYVLPEPIPRYSAEGVSRESSISVEFSVAPSSSSFIFEENEIPTGAQKQKDEEGIWAYTLDDQTFFKNISITDANDISIAHYFTKPVLDGTLLIISPDKNNKIEIDANSETKLINVTLSGNITDEKNSISMNEDKSWKYQVNKTTNIVMPKISQYSPQYKLEGVECDSEIVITFNKPVRTTNLTLFSDSTQEGTIQITDASNPNEHLESYFSISSKTDTSITIKPSFQIHNLVPSVGNLKNLKVSLDYQSIKDLEGNELAEDNSNWIYRINHEMEKVGPVVNIALYKPVFDFDEETDDYLELSCNDELFTEGGDIIQDDEILVQNHVGSYVKFDATASDESSGYKQLVIKETLICTVDETVVDKSYGTTTIESAAYGSSFNKKKYVFKSDMDGIIQLDFCFQDYAGNETKRSYFVVKDTTLDSSVMLNSKRNYVNDRIVHNDMITETLDFSECADSWFKGRSRIFQYSVLWGYDDRYCDQTPTTNKDKTIFTFQRDPNYDCFVKIKACDLVGNYREYIRCIPCRLGIIKLGENQATEGGSYAFSSPVITLDGDYSNTTITGLKDYYQLVLWRYKPDELSEFGEFYHDGSSEVTDIIKNYFDGETQNFEVLQRCSEFGDGIYEISIISCLIYNEQRQYCGPLSKPYIYYKGVTPTNPITDTQEPEFPETFSVRVNPPRKSSGVTEGSVTLPKGFTKTNGYTYGVYTNQGDKYFGYLGFVLESTGTYALNLFAISDTTGKLYTSPYNSVSADCSTDNIPPFCAIEGGVQVSDPNKMYPFFYDNEAGRGGGMYYNAQKQAFEVEYYLIKKDDKTGHTDTIKRSDLSNLQDKKIVAYLDLPTDYYDNRRNGYYTALDYGDNFLESYYTLILDLQDKNQNRGLYSLVVSNICYPAIPKLFGFEVDPDDSNKYTFYRKFSCTKFFDGISFSYLKDGKNWIRDDSTYYFGWEPGDVVKLGINCNNYAYHNSNILKKDSFVCFGSSWSQTNDYYSSLNTYFLPAYELMSDVEKAQYCQSKSVMQGIAGTYQVFYDSPCFAHTMIFPTNMLDDIEAKVQEALWADEDLSEEEARTAVWETKGRELGLQLLNDEWLTLNTTRSATYKAPVSDIEKGYSYVTVFHFADGSSLMSEVKSK